MTCPPCHFLLSRDSDGNVVGACLKCGADMPPEKAANTDRHQAASRKSHGKGRDWRGKAMTVVLAKGIGDTATGYGCE